MRARGITLDQARQCIGHGVVYDPGGYGPREDGEIVRVSDRYVFVLYAGDNTAKATLPEHLTLLSVTS